MFRVLTARINQKIRCITAQHGTADGAAQAAHRLPCPGTHATRPSAVGMSALAVRGWRHRAGAASRPASPFLYIGASADSSLDGDGLRNSVLHMPGLACRSRIFARRSRCRSPDASGRPPSSFEASTGRPPSSFGTSTGRSQSGFGTSTGRF